MSPPISPIKRGTGGGGEEGEDRADYWVPVAQSDNFVNTSPTKRKIIKMSHPTSPIKG